MQGRQLLERRTRMLTLKAQGVPLKTIIQDLSQEQECTPQALYTDWRKRELWATDVAQLDDPILLGELIQGLKQVIPNAWYEYKTNPNPSVKLGALKLVKETYVTLIEVLQSVGRLTKVPEALNIGLKWLDSENNNDTVQTSQGTG